jgi:hypothetical protein
VSNFEASLALYDISILLVELDNLGAGWASIDVLQEGLEDVIITLSLALDLWNRVRMTMVS